MAIAQAVSVPANALESYAGSCGGLACLTQGRIDDGIVVLDLADRTID